MQLKQGFALKCSEVVDGQSCRKHLLGNVSLSSSLIELRISLPFHPTVRAVLISPSEWVLSDLLYKCK